MEAVFEPRQPRSVDDRSFAGWFREWTLTASRRRGQTTGDNAQPRVTTCEAADRQPAMMIKPSTHERVVLGCATRIGREGAAWLWC